ncbi:MAG: hypothetical protein ACXVA9_00810 [Bdellovibrionales bacterium]
MPRLVIIAFILVATFSLRAFAAEEKKSEGASSLKIENVTGQKNKVAGDIDEEISNAKMRAESGSKSKYSASTKIDYTGGSVASPFNAERPNLSGVPGNEVQSSVSATLNARYRATKNDSFTGGTSFAMMSPLKSERKTNFRDPNIGYNHAAKVGAFQTVGILTYAYGTSNESKANNLTHQFVAQYNAMHAFGNGWTAGALFSADYNNYTTRPGTNTDTATTAYGHDKRVAWDFSIYPQAEYKFNDKYSARTVFGYFNWKHLYGDDNKARMLQKFIYQSLGVGISITRDIFLYPNVQFVPDNIRSDFTNVAMSATINVF